MAACGVHASQQKTFMERELAGVDRGGTHGFCKFVFFFSNIEFSRGEVFMTRCLGLARSGLPKPPLNLNLNN
jgi:hypothetical protein